MLAEDEKNRVSWASPLNFRRFIHEMTHAKKNKSEWTLWAREYLFWNRDHTYRPMHLLFSAGIILFHYRMKRVYLFKTHARVDNPRPGKRRYAIILHGDDGDVWWRDVCYAFLSYLFYGTNVRWLHPVLYSKKVDSPIADCGFGKSLGFYIDSRVLFLVFDIINNYKVWFV